MVTRNQTATTAKTGTPVTFLDGSSWPLPSDPRDRTELLTKLQGELNYQQSQLVLLKELQPGI